MGQLICSISISMRYSRSTNFSTTMPCQQWPFFQDNYYALFLNRRHGFLSDKRNCSLLKGAIDYRAINFYLRMGEVAEEAEIVQPSQPLDIRVACSRVVDPAGGTLHHLAHLIGQSAGSTVVNPISVKGEMREEADAFFNSTLFWFGVQPLVTILPFRWGTQLFWIHQSPS